MAWDFLFLLLLLLILLDRLFSGASTLLILTVLACYLAALYVRERNNRRRFEFISQLKSCRKELRSGGTVVVENLLLRYDTPLTSYLISFGIVARSVTIHSPYYRCREELHPAAYLFSLLSLVTGWWSITGPLDTAHALLENLTGGTRITVGRLIDAPLFREPDPQSKGPRQKHKTQINPGS